MKPRHANTAPILILLVFLGASQLTNGLQCEFRIPPYTYDLCPLLSASSSLTPPTTSSGSSRYIQGHEDRETPPTVTREEYIMNLGGEGIPRDGTLPVTEQCPAGTWICFRISNTRPNHPSEPRRILQIVPVAGNIPASNGIDKFSGAASAPSGVNATARLGSKKTNGFPSLEITLNGGSYLSRPQRALFTFLCDTSIQEPSLPVPSFFPLVPGVYSTDSTSVLQSNTHTFTWRTRHACPVAQDEPQKSPTDEQPSGPSDGDDNGRDSDDGTGPEEDIAPGVPLSDDARLQKTKIGGIVIGCIAIVALVTYGMYILRAQRRKRPYSSLPPGDTARSYPRLPFELPTLPWLSFSMLPFLGPYKRSRRTHVWSEYDPLTAEEYEIRDEEFEREEDNGAVVDFQRQGLLQGSNTTRGYGSVR